MNELNFEDMFVDEISRKLRKMLPSVCHVAPNCLRKSGDILHDVLN